MLFCVRSSLTHDRDDSLKKNIPALFSFFFSPPDASRHNISSIKQTTIYVLPAFDPKRTAEWLLLQKCKGRQRHKEKSKRKSERENVDGVKQCEELWIRRSEIRPFNCICALFSFITMLTLVLRRIKSSFTLQPITKQKLLLFESFNWFIKVIQTKFLRLLSLTLKRFFCISSSCCSATFQRNKAAQTHNTWKGFQFIGTQHIKWN